jgi:hypothetical protein
MARVGGQEFTWIEDDDVEWIMGNPRPKTLADIENDHLWDKVFRQWVQAQSNVVQDAYAKWQDDPKGDARDELKNLGVRDTFYKDVGSLKEHKHQADAQRTDARGLLVDRGPEDSGSEWSMESEEDAGGLLIDAGQKDSGSEFSMESEEDEGSEESQTENSEDMERPRPE